MMDSNVSSGIPDHLMMDSNVSSGLPDYLMMDSNVSSGLPDHLMMDSNEVKDKADIVGVFNKLIISAGSVFDNGGAQASNVSSVTVNYDIGPHVNHFNFDPVSYAESIKH
jgi:antirestriction protein ArdC